MPNAKRENRANPPRILYFGTYRAEYSRNRILIEGLRANGAQVVECHETLWHSIDDRVNLASGGWVKPAFWWRVLRTYFRLLRRYFGSGDYDVLVVGYPGQFDVYLAWLLARLKGRPFCWDILMSIYLVAVERKLDQRSAFTVRLLKLVEKIASALPDRLILESTDYRDWFCKTHHVSPERFCLVPLGTQMKPIPPEAGQESDVFWVTYFGTFIPNHGVDRMIEAAARLTQWKAIRFEMIGTGPELERAKALAREHGLENIDFSGYLDDAAFREHIARAKVVLGVFGSTPQSLMTIQNKIYECLAMGKPLVTGESPLLCRTFEHARHMYICRREPESLAEAILALRQDEPLRERIAREGNAYFQQNFSVQQIGKQFLDCLEAVRR